MNSLCKPNLHLFSFPDDIIDRILNNLTFENLLAVRLVCHAFNKSAERVLASVTVLEDNGEPVELIVTLLPYLKNLSIVRHFAIGTDFEEENSRVLELLSKFCEKITYIQYAPVAFVSDYIKSLEEANKAVFVSKIKVSNVFDLNCRELATLLEKYLYIEVFVDELDLQTVLNETWSDDDGLLRHRITGLNPGVLKLNSSPIHITKLLSSLINLRSLWIKVSIDNVDAIAANCSSLSHLYIEDVEACESPDFTEIETLIRTRVPGYRSFSLCLANQVPEAKVKHILQLLVQCDAKFRLHPDTEWLSCDLCLGSQWHVWTKECILYIKSWSLESLHSMLCLFLPTKRIQVEQAVSRRTKAKWEAEIAKCATQMKVKAPCVSFTTVTRE